MPLMRRQRQERGNMPKGTQAQKRLIQANIDDFVRDQQPLTVQQYKRLASWLAGMTMAEIAEEEGVTQQAVGASIKRDSQRILNWALAPNSDKQ